MLVLLPIVRFDIYDNYKGDFNKSSKSDKNYVKHDCIIGGDVIWLTS